MPHWLDMTLLITGLIVWVLACGVCVVMVTLQLPGTWIMVALTGLMVLWRWEPPAGGAVGLYTLGALVVLAGLGELVETVAGAVGSRGAGSSWRASLMAIGGGVVGALTGAIAMSFVPGIGTIIGGLIGTIGGAMVGAGIASTLGDRWAGRTWRQSLRSGGGAAIGRFGGTMGKLVVAVVMWVLVCISAIVP